MTRKMLVGAGLALAAVVLMGCATIFGPGPDDVGFGSEPEGAEVIVNGELMGHTPVTLKLRPEKTYVVTFRRDGYEPATVMLTTHVQPGWVVLDIFAGVVGVAIDSATGKWKTFDDRQQFVVLQEADG
ncbi:MAG: PEGA domain-containing protein [Gemmatimonadota bacterium]|nr:MAG: PEGA domain-containing protein [Gemmatimonadota bacterium]